MDILGTIGKAAGVKPADNVIVQGILGDAKLKAISYCMGTLESATPQVRDIMQRHLNDALDEQRRWSQLAIQEGIYQAYASPGELIQQALTQATTALQ